MRVDTIFQPAESLIATGRFKDANQRFALDKAVLIRGQQPQWAAVIAAELALELGPLEKALSLARSVSSDGANASAFSGTGQGLQNRFKSRTLLWFRQRQRTLSLTGFRAVQG